MSSSYTIVGFTYQGDLHCIDCVSELVAKAIDKTGIVFIGRQDWETTDEYLDRAAPFLGVRDRYDETTFDSDTFPKVVFADQVEDTITCGTCTAIV